MSVHTAPLQAGGAAVLGASALKASAETLERGRFFLAATGGAALQFLAALGVMLIALGMLLVRRGRGTTLGRSFE